MYHNLGNMATIGRNSAVGDLPRLRLKGYLAWLFWLFVHIFKLIGFRNRLSVMTQWAFCVPDVPALGAADHEPATPDLRDRIRASRTRIAIRFPSA